MSFVLDVWVCSIDQQNPSCLVVAIQKGIVKGSVTIDILGIDSGLIREKNSKELRSGVDGSQNERSLQFRVHTLDVYTAKQEHEGLDGVPLDGSMKKRPLLEVC